MLITNANKASTFVGEKGEFVCCKQLKEELLNFDEYELCPQGVTNSQGQKAFDIESVNTNVNTDSLHTGAKFTHKKDDTIYVWCSRCGNLAQVIIEAITKTTEFQEEEEKERIYLRPKQQFISNELGQQRRNKPTDVERLCSEARDHESRRIEQILNVISKYDQITSIRKSSMIKHHVISIFTQKHNRCDLYFQCRNPMSNDYENVDNQVVQSGFSHKSINLIGWYIAEFDYNHMIPSSFINEFLQKSQDDVSDEMDVLKQGERLKQISNEGVTLQGIDRKKISFFREISLLLNDFYSFDRDNDDEDWFSEMVEDVDGCADFNQRFERVYCELAVESDDEEKNEDKQQFSDEFDQFFDPCYTEAQPISSTDQQTERQESFCKELERFLFGFGPVDPLYAYPGNDYSYFGFDANVIHSVDECFPISYSAGRQQTRHQPPLFDVDSESFDHPRIIVGQTEKSNDCVYELIVLKEIESRWMEINRMLGDNLVSQMEPDTFVKDEEEDPDVNLQKAHLTNSIHKAAYDPVYLKFKKLQWYECYAMVPWNVRKIPLDYVEDRLLFSNNIIISACLSLQVFLLFNQTTKHLYQSGESSIWTGGDMCSRRDKTPSSLNQFGSKFRREQFVNKITEPLVLSGMDYEEIHYFSVMFGLYTSFFKTQRDTTFGNFGVSQSSEPVLFGSYGKNEVKQWFTPSDFRCNRTHKRYEFKEQHSSAAHVEHNNGGHARNLNRRQQSSRKDPLDFDFSFQRYSVH